MSTIPPPTAVPPAAPAETGLAVILARGMRPFFLLAGLYGAVSVAAWLGALAGLDGLPEALPPVLWHGHEMVFGFAVAAVCGFLLTAVPAWTGAAPVTGAPLAALVALWLAGRAAMWAADVLPPALVAVADLALLVVFGVVIGRVILASGQRRNFAFTVFLVLLVAANLLFHLELMGAAGTGMFGLHLAGYVLALMVAVIGGRIVPNFTANAFRMAGVGIEVRTSATVDRLALAAIAATAIADLAGGGILSGLLAAAAAVLLVLRMARWHTAKTLGQPILWVLHLGHGWLAAAFACKAAADLAGLLPASAAFHALTVGAVGTMVLGVMTRAALGHTGRPLVVAGPIVVAYLLVTVSALLRVLGPAALPGDIMTWSVASGVAWIAAFGTFTVVYWPVLTRRRVDGAPG